MDLSVTFDCINHTRLWAIMLDLGVDPPIVVFLRQLYQDATASVQYGINGECTEPFRIQRGVRRVRFSPFFIFPLYQWHRELLIL